MSNLEVTIFKVTRKYNNDEEFYYVATCSMNKAETDFPLDSNIVSVNFIASFSFVVADFIAEKLWHHYFNPTPLLIQKEIPVTALLNTHFLKGVEDPVKFEIIDFQNDITFFQCFEEFAVNLLGKLSTVLSNNINLNDQNLRDRTA